MDGRLHHPGIQKNGPRGVNSAAQINSNIMIIIDRLEENSSRSHINAPIRISRRHQAHITMNKMNAVAGTIKKSHSGFPNTVAPIIVVRISAPTKASKNSFLLTHIVITHVIKQNIN